MGFQFVGFVAMLLLALAVVAYGLFGPKRSLGIALIALAVTLLVAGGAWCAWAESHSISWTIGYGVVMVVSIAAAARQLVGMRSPVLGIGMKVFGWNSAK